MEKVLQTDVKREPSTLYCCKGDPIAIYKVKPGRKKVDVEAEMREMEKEHAEQH